MSATARLAVIMPAYNAAGTIGAALASAQLQSLRAIEIVVVDDGSTDSTAAIVEAVAAGDSRVRLLRQKNAGPMVARNRAIASSIAPFVAPLDADDLWHPDYLARMIEALAVPETPGFAYALHHVIDPHDRIVATPPTLHVAGPAYHRHLLTNFVGAGSAAVFRRDALLAASAYDARTWQWGGAEDYLLQLRITADWPIACVPRRLVGYRRVPGSLSDDPQKMARARRLAVLTALDEHGGPSLPIERWVASDADRTAAALLALRGRWRAALPLAFRAMLADPVAAFADAAQRLRNRRERRPVQAAKRGFVEADGGIEPASIFRWPVAARLRRLAVEDGRARLPRGGRPPEIPLDPADEDEKEIA